MMTPFHLLFVLLVASVGYTVANNVTSATTPKPKVYTQVDFVISFYENKIVQGYAYSLIFYSLFSNLMIHLDVITSDMIDPRAGCDATHTSQRES